MKEKSFSKLINDFIQMETGNGFFNTKIKSRNFWDYIRYLVFEIVITRNVSEDTLDVKRKTIISYVKLVFELLCCLTGYFVEVNRIRRRRYDLVFVSGNDRKGYFEGKKVDIYFYPIIAHLQSKYKILVINAYQENEGGEYPCDVLHTRHFRLIDKLKSKCVLYSKNEKKFISKIGQQIVKVFNINYDIQSLVHQHFSMELKNYKRHFKLLRRFSPRAVIYVNNGKMKSLIDAAADLKIVTIELQHAVISFLNTLYSYPSDASLFDKISHPDYFFMFGDFWRSECSLPCKKVAVGFPYLAYQKKMVPSNIQKDPKKIIIYSDMYFSRLTLTKLTLDLSNALPDYTIFFKLRREEYEIWGKKYPSQFAHSSNIVVIDNDNKPLYEYMAQCSFQIGINSTALYEGLNFDLVMFILKTGFYEEMAPLYQGGYAFLVSESKQIIDLIKSNTSPDNRLPMEQVFKSNGLKNIWDELSIILNPI